MTARAVLLLFNVIETNFLRASSTSEFSHSLGPLRADGSPVVGKIGGDLTPEQGYEAARLVALGMLANIRAHLGSLDRVVRFAKVVGRVNATPEFMGHAQVIDGYTDLMVSVFGDSALCARSAPGMGSAPFQVAVIADAILQVR